MLAENVAPGAAESGARLFVWLGWAVMSVIALTYVARFGPTVPVRDDFDVVERLSGGGRVSLQWLWALHNEHRIPLPKLLLVSLYKCCGNDFRAGMFCSVALLSVLAATSLVVAGRRDGGNRSYDLAFPLWFLSLAHVDNLLWSWQVGFVLPSMISGGLILLIASRVEWPHWAAVLAGAALAALTLCGANGIAVVPAFVCWLFWVAVSRRSAPSLFAALVGLGLTIFYFVGYQAAANHSPAHDLAAVARTSLQFASLIFGTEARELWPVSAVAAVVLVSSSIAVLLRVVLFGPTAERPRALGILAAFAAQGCLVLALGWGRAGSGEFAGFESRYVTLICPIWIAVFFTWDLYASMVWRRVVLNTLVSAYLILLWPTTQKAIDVGRALSEQANQFVSDIRAGEPIYRLARRHTPFIYPSQDELARQLALLRDTRIGVFALLAGDPSFREIPVAVEPASVTLGRWEKGTFHGTGVDPYLHYVLPTADRIAGIRLDYSHSNMGGTPGRFRLLWSSFSGDKPAASQVAFNWNLPTGLDRSTVIWIDDVVKEFWIQPDNQACEFGVRGISLFIDPRPRSGHSL